jgi:hypothetical protein
VTTFGGHTALHCTCMYYTLKSTRKSLYSCSSIIGPGRFGGGYCCCGAPSQTRGARRGRVERRGFGAPIVSSLQANTNVPWQLPCATSQPTLEVQTRRRLISYKGSGEERDNRSEIMTGPSLNDWKSSVPPQCSLAGQPGMSGSVIARDVRHL